MMCDTEGSGPEGSTYLCPSDWSWALGLAGSRPRTLIPSVATALSRIEPIASTESFSRTSTLHLLSRAAFTWKDGFSVVAPIRVTVPHSTWGRKVSYRYTHILREGKEESKANLGEKKQWPSLKWQDIQSKSLVWILLCFIGLFAYHDHKAN